MEFSSRLVMGRAGVLLLLTILVHASSEAPPRIVACRMVHKAKAENIHLEVNLDGSCEGPVTIPLRDGLTLNLTDTRNCANYYKCEGLQCDQCPCPLMHMFNPLTRRCEIGPSECRCPALSTSPEVTTTMVKLPPPTVVATTTAATTTAAPVTEGKIPTLDAGHRVETTTKKDDKEVNTELIIIAGIISATVIIVVIIVMAVFLWQRNRFKAVNKQQTVTKLSSSPALEGYIRTVPVQERHVYAEIDERMVSGGTKHWQHGTMPPALPDHQPPIHVCPFHHHTDSGVSSADTSFNYPRQHNSLCSPGMRFANGHLFPRPNGEDIYDHTGRDGSSVSSDSQYSQSSHQTSLDSHDVDMRTPLQNKATKPSTNYVSKQVYI